MGSTRRRDKEPKKEGRKARRRAQERECRSTIGKRARKEGKHEKSPPVTRGGRRGRLGWRRGTESERHGGRSARESQSLGGSTARVTPRRAGKRSCNKKGANKQPDNDGTEDYNRIRARGGVKRPEKNG